MQSDRISEHAVKRDANTGFMKGWGFEMNLKDQMNGVQHVGVPTNDIETTIKFYEALGFEIAFQTVNEAANEKVAFLKLGNLVIETYENKAAKMESGAIDHVAIDVKDVEKVHELEETEEELMKKDENGGNPTFKESFKIVFKDMLNKK